MVQDGPSRYSNAGVSATTELEPSARKRKPASPILPPLPVYNQSLSDAHNAEKVARARVDTEETKLAIQGRQKRTRYATAMLRDGEEDVARGSDQRDQREQAKRERADLREMFGIDTDSEPEDDPEQDERSSHEDEEDADEEESIYEDEEEAEDEDST
ncbi:hypothetical protein F444_09777, partial [Phytophthora nicotianae P1976]